jgi:hypothetical protein
MKTTLRVLVAMAVLAISHQAQALTLLPTEATCSSDPSIPCLLASGTDQSQDDINAAIDSLIGDATVLYKSTQSTGAEVGPYVGQYDTVYGTLDPASAQISYTNPDPISSDPVYVLIKDGKIADSGVAWYLYDVSGWNGTETLDFSGFFLGNQGKISHVSIYGTVSTVPDGGSTLTLLGSALFAFGVVARRFRKTY